MKLKILNIPVTTRQIIHSYFYLLQSIIIINSPHICINLILTYLNFQKNDFVYT